MEGELYVDEGISTSARSRFSIGIFPAIAIRVTMPNRITPLNSFLRGILCSFLLLPDSSLLEVVVTRSLLICLLLIKEIASFNDSCSSTAIIGEIIISPNVIFIGSFLSAITRYNMSRSVTIPSIKAGNGVGYVIEVCSAS